MRSVLPLVCPPVQLYVAQLPTVKAWFSTWLQMRCLSAAWDIAVPGSTALRATMRRREVTRGRIMKRLREAWGTTSGLGKLYISRKFATVAELADAPALGAGGATRGGSSPSGRMTARSTEQGAVCSVLPCSVLPFPVRFLATCR